MERSQISAIVLAAGSSRRMGTTKQLLPVGRGTMLQQTILNLVTCPLTETLVVLGHEAEKIRQGLTGLPVTVVVNHRFHEGMSSSIKCGLQHVKPSCGSVLIALGDQPFIASHTVAAIIEAYLKSDKGIAYPTHRGVKGHPVILDRKYEGEMRRLSGDTGCRQILDAHPDDHLALEVEDEKVLWDMDYPDDYALLPKEESQK